MQSDNIQKDLIRKYINQDCTPEELDDIKKLMLLPEAQRIFDEILAESWTGFESERNIDQPRLNKQLKTFYDRVEREEESALRSEKFEQTITHAIKRKSYLQYAAVLALLVLGLSTYTLIQFKKTPVKEIIAMRQMVNANGQRSKITLSDSSEVFLGAGSKLTFPDKFEAGRREVSLEGEAFFQITKNPYRPFIIHTRSVQTMVLGTSFRIEAFENHPLVVSVATGKVRVDDYAGRTVKSLAVLMPGQKVTYKMGNAVTGTTDIDDVKSWKDGRLVFNKRPLKEITAELERWYNVKMVYRDEVKASEEITIVLQANVPLAKIMKVLSATGHFYYTINEKTITIN